jgi:hypothetical protein
VARYGGVVDATQTGVPQRSRSRLVISLLASVVVLALGIFFVVRMLGDNVKSGGPLAHPDPDYRDASTAPVALNEPYSWGLIYLDNRGSDPAQVEALDLGQVPSGLHVLGSYAVPGNAGIGLLAGYASNRGRPVVGLTIPPRETYNVVVGLSATAPGQHAIPLVRVRYSSGNQEYEATFNQAVVLCAPKADYKHGCTSSL